MSEMFHHIRERQRRVRSHNQIFERQVARQERAFYKNAFDQWMLRMSVEHPFQLTGMILAALVVAGGFAVAVLMRLGR